MCWGGNFFVPLIPPTSNVLLHFKKEFSKIFKICSLDTSNFFRKISKKICEIFLFFQKMKNRYYFWVASFINTLPLRARCITFTLPTAVGVTHHSSTPCPLGRGPSPSPCLPGGVASFINTLPPRAGCITFTLPAWRGSLIHQHPAP